MMPEPSITQLHPTCPQCGRRAEKSSVRDDDAGVRTGSYCCRLRHIWMTHWAPGVA